MGNLKNFGITFFPEMIWKYQSSILKFRLAPDLSVINQG
jgi:hypothetical protein